MATHTETKINGFEWRTLLGPTHNWSVPTAELTTAQLKGSTERCELCGQPIVDGKPFTTNSAGQRAMHIACLNEPEPTRSEPRPTRQVWRHLRQAFVRG